MDGLLFILWLPYAALTACQGYVINISLSMSILMGFGRLAFQRGVRFA